MLPLPILTLFSFFLHVTSPSEIYTLSLHDALPIFRLVMCSCFDSWKNFSLFARWAFFAYSRPSLYWRSEEHTSELQSHSDLVCRLLLEKKKKKKNTYTIWTKPNKYNNCCTQASGVC